MNRHTELTRVQAEIDGLITEAASQVNEPDNQAEISVAAKVLADMERAREAVEGELRGE